MTTKTGDVEVEHLKMTPKPICPVESDESFAMHGIFGYVPNGGGKLDLRKLDPGIRLYVATLWISASPPRRSPSAAMEERDDRSTRADHPPSAAHLPRGSFVETSWASAAAVTQAGSINAYYCPDCQSYVVVIHRDEGVTPMFLACRAKGEPTDPANDCKGMSTSLGYPAAETWPIPRTPTWEWYKPDAEQIAEMDEAGRDHIERGGLDIRKI